MFIRQTKTRTSPATGETYHTFRLVTSERIGTKVRQRTLLNLGRNFSLPKEQWPKLCARMDMILSGQGALYSESPEIEELAQRYVAQLVVKHKPDVLDQGNNETAYQEVDIASLELVRPRSVGVEHAGLAALSWLGIPQIVGNGDLV
jgi:hypothetical protein